MKIVAFSDSHNHPALLTQAVLQAQQTGVIDICVHCGDGIRDLDTIEPILRQANPNVRLYGVRGNCDLGVFQYHTVELFDANGIRFMVTHGHTYHVKDHYEGLRIAARGYGAKVAFFGHTHRSLLTESCGVTLINPGAIINHLPGGIAYAQVLVEPSGEFRADLFRWLA